MERPSDRGRVKFVRRGMNDVGVSLAGVATFDVVMAVGLHARPEVA